MRAPRVLIIENDFLIGEMLHDMVAELGYSVTKVAHGLPSALNEISKENFDGALVNIGIDDHGLADSAVGLQSANGHSNIVNGAETFAVAGMGMMETATEVAAKAIAKGGLRGSDRSAGG